MTANEQGEICGRCGKPKIFIEGEWECHNAVERRVVWDGRWMLSEDAPAGRAGLVVLAHGNGIRSMAFGEWRVVNGIEDWFDSAGDRLVGVTHWMPEPDLP